jgi:hypothetical protein
VKRDHLKEKQEEETGESKEPDYNDDKDQLEEEQEKETGELKNRKKQQPGFLSLSTRK